MGFPFGSVIKHLPVIQEMWVQSLGWEDCLEEGVATHCLENPTDRGTWWAQSIGSLESDINEVCIQYETYLFSIDIHSLFT